MAFIQKWKNQLCLKSLFFGSNVKLNAQKAYFIMHKPILMFVVDVIHS
jgi:hypothetical protein